MTTAQHDGPAGHLSLEASLAMRRLGYPQTIVPRLIWQQAEGMYMDQPGGVLWRVNTTNILNRRFDPDREIACPAETAALNWLESEHIIGEWWREDRRYFFEKPDGAYYSVYDHEGGADEALNDYPMPFPSPSALVLAIAAYAEANHAATD